MLPSTPTCPPRATRPRRRRAALPSLTPDSQAEARQLTAQAVTRYGEPSRARHEPAWSSTSTAVVDAPEALPPRSAATRLAWSHLVRGLVHVPFRRIARRSPRRPPMSGAPKAVLPIPLIPPTESTAPLQSCTKRQERE